MKKDSKSQGKNGAYKPSSGTPAKCKMDGVGWERCAGVPFFETIYESSREVPAQFFAIPISALL